MVHFLGTKIKRDNLQFIMYTGFFFRSDGGTFTLPLLATALREISTDRGPQCTSASWTQVS